MTTLLLVAHGSRHADSNAEIARLAAILSQRLGAGFDQVCYAFLELTPPRLMTVLEQAIQAGSHQIIVLPYFLSAGRHVEEDLPRCINAIRCAYPQIDLRIAPHLGAAVAIPELLSQLALAAFLD